MNAMFVKSIILSTYTNYIDLKSGLCISSVIVY